MTSALARAASHNIVTSVALAPPHARTGTRRQLEHTSFYLQPLKRVVHQAVELAEFAGVINARQCAGKVERLCSQQPAANRRTEAIADAGGFADSRRRNCVAQA